MGVLEEKENSMRYWFPKLENILGIQYPSTVMVDAEKFPDGDTLIGVDKDLLLEAAEKVGGYPVFIRTDHASDKHHMEDVSKVNSADEMMRKVHDLARHNLNLGMFGVEYTAVAVREWLDIDHGFHAFIGNAPIGAEIRAFIRDGNITCHHFYWPKDSIKRPNCEDWEYSWKQTKEHALDNWRKMEMQVEKVAEHFEGAWSVDGALVDGEWYIIDMAKYEDSYHEPSCPNAPEEMKKRYGDSSESEGRIEELEELVEGGD